MKLFEYPEHLRPFVFHGMDVSHREGHSQAIADCFMCGKEAKFHISIETGQWDCKVCGEKGNVFSFIRKLWEHSSDCSEDSSDKVALTKLRATRTLLSTNTLISWGVRRSCLTNEWIVPGWTINKQSIGQMYRWVKDREKGKHLLLATPGIGHHLFGLNLFNEKAKTVYICEGPWDGMALWETLSKCSKMEDGRFKEAASKKMSLLSESSVIAVPGCNAFNELWGEVLENRDVVFLYDNDHVIDQTKQGDPPALAGLKKAVRTLTSSEFKAASIKYLNWGKEHGVSYDPKLASGFDVRDALSGESIKDRINSLQSIILQRIDPIPDDWKGEAKKTLPCNDWKTLVNEWKKALRWTDGLDNGLAVMLASIASTETPGDQLWVKIIGPPSCLDGDTPIYDPVDNTTLTVKERYLAGKRFNVYTIKSCGGIGIAEALPPQEFDEEDIYEVVFKSGRTISVTKGHQFWTGEGYVALSSIVDELRVSSSYRLPTISGTDLLARLKDAHRSLRTTPDSQCGCHACSCSCGEQLLQDEGISRCVSPSPSGVLERSHCYSCAGVLDYECRHTPQCSYRPSNYQTSPLSELLQHVGGCEFCLNEGTYEQCVCSSGNVWQSPELIAQTGRDGPSHQSVHKSKEQSSLCVQQHDDSEPNRFGCRIDYNQNSVQLRTDFDQNCTSPIPSSSGDCLETSLNSSSVTSVKVDHNTLGLVILHDEIISVKVVKRSRYYDFMVPETQNYWACGVFNHNCGKSTLCEAVSTSEKYVMQKSVIRGFHSGFKLDKEGKEDLSLLAKLRNKTLVTKDGDTLMKSPNAPQILSEARDIYDKTTSAHYRNNLSREYKNICMTWILCGTSSLRSLDQSELGERFLDCVIVHEMDMDLEKQIQRRVINRQIFNMISEDKKAEDEEDGKILRARRLTGGYVEYLRKNILKKLKEIKTDSIREKYIEMCENLALFVAHIRSRPSLKQQEEVERELSLRLCSQLTKLMLCLVVVTGKKTVDDEVMRRVTKVALDTARGRTFNIVKRIYKQGDTGIDHITLSKLTNESRDKELTLLRFLKKINVVQVIGHKKNSHLAIWALTPQMKRLFTAICGEMDIEDNHYRLF